MNLNDDLESEILLHLPVHSLLRFRSVCKSWCNIIDSSNFIESHLQNQSKNNFNKVDDTLFFLQYRASSPSLLKADNGKLHYGFTAFEEFYNDNPCDYLFVTSSVNGMICMYYDVVHKARKHKRKHKRCLPTAIYNPSLDKLKILPDSPICSSLVYDYRNLFSTNRGIGFGFDCVTKDYKVVQLISSRYAPLPLCAAEVYSGLTKSWRKLENTLYHGLSLNFIQGINSSVNTKSGSMVHWRVSMCTIRDDAILSFDLQNEVFEMISYPTFRDGKVDILTSMVFAKDDDSFVLFIFAWDHSKLEVWELERRDKRCWTHVTNIVNGPTFVYSVKRLEPKSLWKKDGVVLRDSYSVSDKLIFYDYSTKKVVKCYEMPSTVLQVSEYKRSLVSP